MRQRRSRSLMFSSALVMLLLSVVALVGCGHGSHENGGNGNDDGSGNSGGAAVMMMNMLPKDAGDFTFIDLAAVRIDSDIYELYGGGEKRIEPDCILLGISADDVDEMAESDNVTILEGSFDLDKLSQRLRDKGYEAYKYERVDMWEDSSAAIQAVALVSESCIVVGSSIDRLKDCVDVIKGNVDSLADGEDVSEVLARLPAGLMVVVHSGDLSLGSEVYGTSSTREDSNTIRVTQVFLFGDDEAASYAMEGLGNALEEAYGTGRVEVRQDGRSIIVTAYLDIDDILSRG